MAAYLPRQVILSCGVIRGGVLCPQIVVSSPHPSPKPESAAAAARRPSVSTRTLTVGVKAPRRSSLPDRLAGTSSTGWTYPSAARARAAATCRCANPTARLVPPRGVASRPPWASVPRCSSGRRPETPRAGWTHPAVACRCAGPVARSVPSRGAAARPQSSPGHHGFRCGRPRQLDWQRRCFCATRYSTDSLQNGVRHQVVIVSYSYVAARKQVRK